ncbi:MAG TPA: cytochrome c oxidase subunit II [Candidatus Saccharimonadales bacterium]|nr:cytochrome c oxidase subunit II [Candidatus Saccharimonadales bacterium]
MQDKPPADQVPADKGMNWPLFFLAGLLLILPTWYVFHFISPYGNMPVDASKQGGGVDQLIKFVHILMGALFVGWIGYFIYVLMRFSKKRNPKADHDGVTSHASTYLEGIVAAIEGVLLIGFAIPIWAHAVDQFPKEADSTVIKVIAQQFQWNGWYPGPHGVFAANDEKFIAGDNPFGLDKKDPHYKENFIVARELEVPVNKPVIVYISSLDVIHCFACRPMRVTQDAIPGMVIPAHFTPAQTGTFQINCAQLCGNGHYQMKGIIKVVPEAEYTKWVASKSSAGAGAGAGYE